MGARPRLLDQVRARIRVKHYSYRTEQQYVSWIRRFILFNDKRRPHSMRVPEVRDFLSHLATEQGIPTLLPSIPPPPHGSLHSRPLHVSSPPTEPGISQRTPHWRLLWHPAVNILLVLAIPQSV